MDTDISKTKQGEARQNGPLRGMDQAARPGPGVPLPPPSHFPKATKARPMLRFLLDGLQYAAGDLKFDDSCPK